MTQVEPVPGVVKFGYIMAIVIPVVGLVIGLTQINRSRHGMKIVAVSILAFFAWFAVLSLGMTTDSGRAATLPASTRVEQAAEEGPAAVKAVGEEAEGDPALAEGFLQTEKTNKMVARIGLEDFATQYSGGGYVFNNRRRNPFATISSCYGGITSWTKFYEYGAWVGEVRLHQSGWCGVAGQEITRDFGWSGSNAAWGPYCITNYYKQAGWDWYPREKHGKVHGTIGISYPWGCAGITTGEAGIRIWANGYWDLGVDF